MRVVGVVLAGPLASIAHADEETVRDFLAASHNNPQDLTAIEAAANGIRTLNIYLDVTRPECEPAGSRACRQAGGRLSKLFCIPAKLPLPPEQIRDIAEKYLDRDPQDATRPSGLYPPGNSLLAGRHVPLREETSVGCHENPVNGGDEPWIWHDCAGGVSSEEVSGGMSAGLRRHLHHETMAVLIAFSIERGRSTRFLKQTENSVRPDEVIASRVNSGVVWHLIGVFLTLCG